MHLAHPHLHSGKVFLLPSPAFHRGLCCTNKSCFTYLRKQLFSKYNWVLQWCNVLVNVCDQHHLSTDPQPAECLWSSFLNEEIDQGKENMSSHFWGSLSEQCRPCILYVKKPFLVPAGKTDVLIKQLMFVIAEIFTLLHSSYDIIFVY